MKTIEYPIIVSKVSNHRKHKKILLDKIQKYQNKYNTGWNYRTADWSSPSTESNLTSDWGEPVEGTDRSYLDYFYSEIINPVMDNVATNLGFADYDWKIVNSWFQQYTDGAEHGWHNHSGAQFTNCYYIELPDTKYKTEVVGSDRELVEFEAKEGDIVTIPAWMEHRAPPVGNERKTVISFNSSFMVKHSQEGLTISYGSMH